MKTRMEADSIGTLEVPSDAYYGVQSLRAKRNFPITGTPINPVMIQNLAKIKKAAAISNREAGRLPEEKAAAKFARLPLSKALIMASSNPASSALVRKDWA